LCCCFKSRVVIGGAGPPRRPFSLCELMRDVSHVHGGSIAQVEASWRVDDPHTIDVGMTTAHPDPGTAVFDSDTAHCDPRSMRWWIQCGNPLWTSAADQAVPSVPDPSKFPAALGTHPVFVSVSD